MKLANLNTVKSLDFKTIKLVSGGYQEDPGLEPLACSNKRDVESASNDSLKRDQPST